MTESGYELRILDAPRVRLLRHAGVTRLTLEGDRSWTKAQPARSFPLSDPDHYIGFLDGDGKDIGLVIDPIELDADSRRVLGEDLELRYFVPVVGKVLKVKEEFGAVYWSAETNRGPKEFVVRNLRDNIQHLSAERVLITDVDGNRFELPDVDALDPITQSIIARSM